MKKLSEHYAYLDVYDRHINLGFNRGALLDDPRGWLEGTGAKFRKLAVRDEAVLGDPYLLELVTCARREREAALGR